METQYVNEDGVVFDTLQDLLDDAMSDTPIAICTTPTEEEEETEEFANWIVDGKEFYPAPNQKITDKLPNGVYKIQETRDGYKVTPYKINTDELYKFSEDFTSKILEEADSFWSKKDLYKQYNISHKRGILLCGAPGCGKTSIINLLIEQIVKNNGIVFMISDTRDFGMLAAMMKPVIRKIEPNRPIITIIEDVNQLIADWGGNDYRLLDFMDGKTSIEDHLIILTSNDTSDLSDALLRPSRIDLTYEIPAPNDKIRKEYFLRKGVSEKSVNKFVKATDGMSFAELKEVFIGTEVQGKNLDDVVKRILNPFECKDYLGKNKKMKGLG